MHYIQAKLLQEALLISIQFWVITLPDRKISGTGEQFHVILSLLDISSSRDAA